MNIIDWLFERAPRGWVPQTGFADSSKRALIWLPGNKEHRDWDHIRHCTERASFYGCTQLAFQSAIEPQQHKPVWVCWLGIDIDEEPINTETLVELCKELGGSVRSSSGGKGRHLVFRLAEPIWTTSDCAGEVVKTLTEPLVRAVVETGHEVCKADRRMFWLSGGRCAFIYQHPGFYHPPHRPKINPNNVPVPGAVEIDPGEEMNLERLGPTVRRWVELLLNRGLIRRVSTRTPIYVGSVKQALESAGEVVVTRSTCRGNGQVNGFLDIRPDYIGLWSFADGHVIWREVEL